MTIRDCMSTDVRTASRQSTIRETARMMKEADALPLGRERPPGRPGHRARHRDPGRGRGHVDNAALELGDLKVRRLPVPNPDKRLVGMMCLRDISKNDGGSQAAAALSGLSQRGSPHKHA